MRTDWTAHRADRYRPDKANRRSATSNLIVGVILIAFGALLLLKNYGIFSFRDVFRLWPVVPIIWGGQAIARARSTFSYLIGGLAITIGSMKLLDNLDIIDISSKLYAPLIFISMGTAFLIYNLKGEASSEESGTEKGNIVTTSSTIHPMIVFGGAVQRVDSQEFEGGEVLCIFGGVELDMRKAKMKSEVALIEVNAVFGGCHLKVPESWSVEIRGTGAFGGYEDKTIAPRPGDGPMQKLIVSGNAVFGGIGIEN